jgi:hypothetical protein
VHSVVVLPVLEILFEPPADFEVAIGRNGDIPEIEEPVNVGSQQYPVREMRGSQQGTGFGARGLSPIVVGPAGSLATI